MNNLKFRAWSVNNKQMYYATPYRGYIKSNGNWWGLYNGDDVEVASSVNDILMQSTGLKDKNGKEIYTGDIINISFYTIVVSLRYFYQFIAKMKPKHIEGIEIIGNIHENGELLK
jgi:uncharacterized phage protein (TIGR01671 family)